MNKFLFKLREKRESKTKTLMVVICSIFLLSLISFTSANWGYDTVGEGTAVRIVNETNTIISGNLTNFTELVDTPSSYSGQSNRCIRVNSGETGLEFFVCPSGGGGGAVDSVTSGDNYLIVSPTTGNVVITQNTTQLNLTIEQIASTFAGGNSSFNQSLTDTLYYSISNPLNFINDTQASIYNDTTLILTVNSSLWDYITNNEADWLSTFNSTYDSFAIDGVQIKYQNITNIPTCSGTDVLSFDGTTLSCIAQTGSGGDLTNVAFINESNTFTPNQTFSGNITADFGFMKTLWENIQNIPNLIVGLWTDNNANDLLVSNGTNIGYNESILNQSIINVAGIYNDTTLVLDINDSLWGYIDTNEADWLTTFNVTYHAKADYQFTTNNFNGTGNFTTQGNLQTNGFVAFGHNSGITVPTGYVGAVYAKNTSGSYELIFKDADGIETVLGGSGGGGCTELSCLTDILGGLSYTNQSVLVADGTNYVERRLNTSDLGDWGTNTPTQIDSHIADTSNPHNVTASQVGAVDLTTNQFIEGLKTFDQFPRVSGTPNHTNDLINKGYGDALASGFRYKIPVRLATTTSLSGSYVHGESGGVGAYLEADSDYRLNIDGINVTNGDRILVKNQASKDENGVYEVAIQGDEGLDLWLLTRATDFDEDTETVSGATFLVLQGDTQTGTAWALLNNVNISSQGNFDFIQISSAVQLEAGTAIDITGVNISLKHTANDGLTIKTGNSLSVDYDDSSIGIVSNKLAVKSSGIVNAMLAGSISNDKLLTIDTASKVNASSIFSLVSLPAGAGIIPTANLGSGSASSSTFLRGDGTWAIPEGGGGGNGTGEVISVIGGGFPTTSTSGNAIFQSLYGDATSASTTITQRTTAIATAGTIRNLYVYKGTGSNGVTVTLYLNGNPTALFCEAGSGTGTTCFNDTASVSVSAGDLVTFTTQRTSGSGTWGHVRFNAEFVTSGGGGSGESNWNVSGSNLFPANLDYKVGIGLNNPSAKLSVLRTEGIGGTTIYGINSTITNTEAASNEGAVAVYGRGVIQAATGGTAAYGIFGTASGGDTNWAGYFDDGDVYIKNKLGIGATTPNRNLHIQNSGSSAITTIERTTSNTSALLLVAGIDRTEIYSRNSDTGTSAVPLIFFRGSNAESMRIDSFGRLGIGITNPDRNLQVASAASTFIAADKTSSTTSSLMWGALGGTNDIYSSTNNTHTVGTPLRFLFGATERLRITSAGRMTIGSGGTISLADSNGNLYVQGNLEVDGLSLDGNIPHYLCYNPSTGGITYAGEESPCSSGASPFFRAYSPTGKMVENIEFLSNINSQSLERYQTFSLVNHDLSGMSVFIENPKPETDYIDLVEIVLIGTNAGDKSGSLGYHVLKPNVAKIANADNDYLIMEQGQKTAVQFDSIPEGFITLSATLRVKGYYIPYPSFKVDYTIRSIEEVEGSKTQVNVIVDWSYQDSTSKNYEGKRITGTTDMVIDTEGMCLTRDASGCQTKIEQEVDKIMESKSKSIINEEEAKVEDSATK